MKTLTKYWFWMCFVFLLFKTSHISGQNSNIQQDKKKMSKMSEKIWTQDEQDVKATVEQFLIVAGNYNLNGMANMMMKNANVGITRLKDGKWHTETMLFTDYFETAKKTTNRPYFEPVMEYTINVSEGQLAFVKADAILHVYGIPTKHNIDYFTLIKENDIWKFINISFTSTLIPEDEMTFDPIIFAKSYAQAWCSQNPEFVAMFYAEDGSLSINSGNASVGRTAIANDAKAFMDAFPDDMIVAFDKLLTTKKGIEFHWTLTGTNTGPNGTGNKVNISGFELWQLDANGLVIDSKGSFDEVKYMLQLNEGLKD